MLKRAWLDPADTKMWVNRKTHPRARKEDWSRRACCLLGLNPSWGLHEPLFPPLSQSCGFRTLLGILEKTHIQIKVGLGLTFLKTAQRWWNHLRRLTEMRSRKCNPHFPNEKLWVESLNFIHSKLQKTWFGFLWITWIIKPALNKSRELKKAHLALGRRVALNTNPSGYCGSPNFTLQRKTASCNKWCISDSPLNPPEWRDTVLELQQRWHHHHINSDWRL